MITRLAKHLKKHYGITIKHFKYYETAFTHKSYVNEHPKRHLNYYERTEFLGDAVMQLCVSEYLFKRFPNMPEGDLSRLRAAMVCEASFSKFAKECHFDRYILLGKGEENANARNRSSLLCDIFESFIGALYLDQGKKNVVKFLNIVVFPKIDMGWFDTFFDHKTVLQELLQRNGQCNIQYDEIWNKDNENDHLYKMEVLENGKKIGEGIGHTKKSAEQAAAWQALKKLNK